MLTNLGDRKQGEMSAYSVFNDNYTRLLGEIDAERLVAETAGGGLAMMPRAFRHHPEAANQMRAGVARRRTNQRNQNQNGEDNE